MSKQEKLTWLTFAVVSLATACLGWLLWTTWPNTRAFGLQEQEVSRYLMLTNFLVLGAMYVTKRKWRLKEPFADERDSNIMRDGNTQALVALALMNVVLSALVVVNDDVLAELDAEWVRYLLLLQVGIAIAIAYGYRIVRYRQG